MSSETKITAASLSGRKTVAYWERGSIEKQFGAKVRKPDSPEFKSQHYYHLTNSLIFKTGRIPRSKVVGELAVIVDVMCSAQWLASSTQLTVTVIVGVPVIIIIL